MKQQIEIKERGFDLQPIIIKRRYKMSTLINWKTTVIGFLIVVVKFFGSTLGLNPDLITYIITTLTGLLGLLAGDGKPIDK